MIIYTLLTIFAMGNATIISLFFTNGFGITSLTDIAMAPLGRSNFRWVAGLLIIVLKGLFSEGGTP